MKKIICCILAACFLLLGACQSASAQNESDTHGAELSVIERDGEYYLHDRYGNEIQGYQLPNGDLEFHLSGKWLILDENREVLYDDIDDMSSDNHAFIYLEDGRTMHRYLDRNGELLLEGVGDEYSGWHYAGFGSCFYQLYWGATRVRNFDTGDEVYLPISPSVGCLDVSMGEKIGKLLLNDFDHKQTYIVEEDLNVTELDGYYVLYQDECGNPYLVREDGILYTLDGTPLPDSNPSVQEELPDEVS